MSRPGAFALLLGRQLTPAVHCGLVVRPIAQQRTGEGQPWACGMDLGQRHTAGSSGPAAKTLFLLPGSRTAHTGFMAPDGAVKYKKSQEDLNYAKEENR